jgi:hypothetical protein
VRVLTTIGKSDKTELSIYDLSIMGFAVLASMSISIDVDEPSQIDLLPLQSSHHISYPLT